MTLRTPDTSAVAPGIPLDPGPPEPAKLLVIDNLRVQFQLQSGTITAVDNVSLSIERGKTLGVIGESGSGKSVTARTVMGLLPETARAMGSVCFEGEELLGLSDNQMGERRGRDVSLVFQDPTRSLNPTMRIGAQVVEAIRTHRALDKDAAHKEAIHLLEMVRIPSAAQRYGEYPHQLSGGMRQRVMIAIALSCRPKLLIADEATTALDVTTQADIMDLLRELQGELGMGLLLISHDMGLAASYTDDVAVMYAGSIVESAPTHTLFRNVRMPYTRALLDAVPRLENPPHGALPDVPGRPPDPMALPPGCRFAPRCPRVLDHCNAALPVLEALEPTHSYACFNPIP